MLGDKLYYEGQESNVKLEHTRTVSKCIEDVSKQRTELNNIL